MVADVHEQRLIQIEHRLDRVESRLDATEKDLAALRESVARVEGALTEIRWTNRALLVGVLGMLIKMAME